MASFIRNRHGIRSNNEGFRSRACLEPFAKDAAQQRIDLRCGRVRNVLEMENTRGKNSIDAGRTIIRNYVPVQAT